MSRSLFGFIGGAYFWLRFGDDFIQAVIVGTIAGLGLSTICCTLQRWNPFKTKCDECGSTNLRAWDYDRDECLDCGAGVLLQDRHGSDIAQLRHWTIFKIATLEERARITL